MKKILTLILFVSSIFLYGQDKKDQIQNTLSGYWEGGFIKGNSFQKLNMEFYSKDEKFVSLQIMEEWHPIYGEFELDVSIDSTGIINVNTGLGKAFLKLDQDNLELIGYIEGQNPSLNVHLKKVPAPPAPDYIVEEVTFKGNEVELSGHVHLPKNQMSETAILIVGGRGCYAGSTKYDLYAKVLRDYGITVLVFNKRGTGKSTGNCETATIEDLANDLSSAKAYLKNTFPNLKKFGAIGSSAGGWVIFKSAEQTDFDFLISVVGPSTSVYEQQMQSLEYGIDEFGLSQKAKTDLIEYTDLVFNAKANPSNLKRMTDLLKLAEKDDWMRILEDTDKVASLEDFPKLWVRRHNYNPAESIKAFKGPYLAVYGEKDWVVPHKENTARLKELRSEYSSEKTRIVVANDAGHGTEVSAEYVKIDNKNTYWRFFRISPALLIEIIDFLKIHGFAN